MSHEKAPNKQASTPRFSQVTRSGPVTPPPQPVAVPTTEPSCAKPDIAPTATERVAQGGVARPPQVVVDLRQEQSAAGVAVEEGDDTAKSGKQDRPKAKTARKRGTQTAMGQGTPATGTGACVVTVPSSLSARIKSDPRPKANLLRAAFETHAPAVVSAHPPRPTPAIEGMQPTMVRREADEGDPFVDVLFKLRVNEKELLDEWVAQTTLTRSGFVTELLVLELE